MATTAAAVLPVSDLAALAGVSKDVMGSMLDSLSTRIQVGGLCPILGAPSAPLNPHPR
jgi:hypothetical protein